MRLNLRFSHFLDLIYNKRKKIKMIGAFNKLLRNAAAFKGKGEFEKVNILTD